MRSIYQIYKENFDASDVLPSWQGENKAKILEFVAKITDAGSKDFVEENERIAVFDNDGTLWCEQPMPIQIQFALERFQHLAKENPKLADNDALQAALRGDLKGLLADGTQNVYDLIMITHTGMTPRAFMDIAREWYENAVHSELQRPVRDLVYAPMIELLVYLEARGFTNYIASAGGMDFMRAIAFNRYGVAPERVIGSEFKTQYELVDGEMKIMRNPGFDSFDDKAMKPVNIQRRIGRRPIFAFGNSDGDYQMLEWINSYERPQISFLLHHTDGVREYAYDDKALSGTLVEGRKDAAKFGWNIVDMKAEWKRVFVGD